jgi:hypothetical protein
MLCLDYPRYSIWYFNVGRSHMVLEINIISLGPKVVWVAKQEGEFCEFFLVHHIWHVCLSQYAHWI